MEARTYYTVDYRVWGADITYTKVFRTLAEAKEFANQDYHDKPIRHTVKSAEKIEHYESSLRLQERGY